MSCWKVENDFMSVSRVIKNLGSGAYGEVNLVEFKGNNFAVKRQAFTHVLMVSQSSLRELDILSRLRPFPYVITMFGACFTDPNVNIILEPMDGSLSQLIQYKLEDRINFFVPLVQDLLIAMTVLEYLNINHYDIKPANILYKLGSRPIFKLTDFGISRGNYLGIRRTDEVVTLWYRPPELLVNRARNIFFDIKIDVWSLGITLYQFLTGSVPWPRVRTETALLTELALNNPNFSHQLINGTLSDGYPVVTKFQGPSYQSIPPQMFQLLQLMLQYEPNQRLSPSQLLNLFPMGQSDKDYLYKMIRDLKPRDDYYRLMPNSIHKMIKTNFVVSIVAIELLTRFYGLLEYRPNDDSTWANVAWYIADRYIQDEPDSHLNIQQMQLVKVLLTTVDFMIYNANLTDKLFSLVQTHPSNQLEYLRSLPSSMWVQPVKTWFQ